MKDITILGIESSCDDTSAAILHNGRILSNVIYTQKIHEKYGGVVPEAASRMHIKHISAVVEEAYIQSGITKNNITAIAYTQKPGLLGSLLIGVNFAKAYAHSLQIPTIAVHHMQAHVISNLIAEHKPTFPFLCLTVSGGHTQIVLCTTPLEMKIIGETIDDAAGEAFDKAAKMLQLPYPGGPLIDKYAKEGNPAKFVFAKPNISGYNYSFSGVKTSILYFLKKEIAQNENFIQENLNDLCASIQHTIISTLMKKLILASKETGIKNICIAGGVSANSGLRNAIILAAKKYHWNYFFPEMQYCTDNAGMIAMLGYYKYLTNEFANEKDTASARGSF